MRYVSTRGEAPAVGFGEALLAGLAPDGGLYVPDAWPTVPPEVIASFAGRPYPEVAAAVLGRFVGDEIPPAELLDLCRAAYAGFSHPAVTPLVQLSPAAFILELFHGPTLAFKDVALQLLARLYERRLANTGRVLTIVCATSGDTGGAAVEAFRGQNHARLVALFPAGRISEVQRRFMTTAAEPNIRAVAVNGDFDDCQGLLKALFHDEAFAREVDLSAVNSINFARVAAQSVYYFVAAAALGAPARRVRFAVPTGNFGDAYAGWAAQAMGLAMARNVVATNANDIVARALESGVYSRGVAVATQSPAMDIQVASNFERLVFDGAERDAVLTAAMFRRFAQAGSATVPPEALARIRGAFAGVSVSEAETRDTIARVHRDVGRLIDPHTAVAVAGAERIAEDGAPTVILSTADPAKFPETVHAATGAWPGAPAAVTRRRPVRERTDLLPPDLSALKAYVRAFLRATT
ncbi:MAG: threonine synthase [Caulobacteraceae bacterium]|nr:threonine synthase [Caulobacteraceae bacterium]